MIDILPLYLLYLLFGALLSLPALLVYFLLFQLLDRNHLLNFTKKLFLIGSAVLGIAVTFWLIGGTMAPGLGIAYSAAAIVFGFLFQLDKRTPARV
jgi:hypothetical protein